MRRERKRVKRMIVSSTWECCEVLLLLGHHLVWLCFGVGTLYLARQFCQKSIAPYNDMLIVGSLTYDVVSKPIRT